MSMPLPQPADRRASPAVRAALRLGLACALGIATAVLIACGSSSKGLISASQAGPLKSDIEAVDLAAQEGDGNCTVTDAALQRTEQDYTALPSSTDAGLHNTLRQGIANLRKVATELCAQPIANTNTVTTPTTTAPATKTTTPTEEKAKELEHEKEAVKEAEEKAAPKEEETEATPAPGGGTPAPGEGNGKSPGEGVGGAGAEETPSNNGAGGLETK